MVDIDFSHIEKKYKNKKVFVTGHTGFKGSWLICWLKSVGAIVYGYSNEIEKDHLYDKINGDSIIDKSYINDIRDYSFLKELICEYKPDFIFHFAAQALVRESYSNPLKTFSTNVMGTANLLNALIDTSFKCTIVIITTDKVYKNLEWNYPYRESDTLGGYDPYSSSKAASELVVSSYMESFFNEKNYDIHRKSISTVRAGNVIGGGDWSKDRLFSDLAKKFSKNEKLIIRNPGSIRPWQHVLEPIGAYLLLGLKLSNNNKKFSRPWNIGPYESSNISVKNIIEKAKQNWKKGIIDYQNDENKLHEASILKLDISDALNILNWSPKLDIDLTVKMTINWYKKFYNGNQAYKLILNDLKFYKKLL